MKKLKLKALGLGANEVLSRSQLKNILGGSDSGSTGSDTGSGSGTTTCSASAQCYLNGPTITCYGVRSCYGRDGWGVTCDKDGLGNLERIAC